jgi:hypothetical protein
MPTYTEPTYLGDVLKREFEQLYNRETVTVISGQNLALGAVVGRITASGKFTALAPAASDGSQNAAGVLLAATDASAADRLGPLLARGPAVVSADHLVWPGGITGGEKTAAIAQLVALGIVSREAI